MTTSAAITELRNRALVLADALEESGDLTEARRIRDACAGRRCETCAYWWSADKMREAAENAHAEWVDESGAVVEEPDDHEPENAHAEWVDESGAVVEEPGEDEPDDRTLRRYRVAEDARVLVGMLVELGADGYIRPVHPDPPGDGQPVFGWASPRRYESLCRRPVTRGSGNVVSGGPVDMPMPADGWCSCYQTEEERRAAERAEWTHALETLRTFRDSDGERVYSDPS